MRKVLLNAIKLILRRFNIGITRANILEKLFRNINAVNDIEFLLKMPNACGSNLLKNFEESKSQLRQDLFVLSVLNFKNNGFFVEFGATNGIDLSNSYLLERSFGWRGILAEPAECWHKELKKNRKCSIETLCVWKDSTSQLTFNEVAYAELSTIDSFSNSDSRKQGRKHGKKYEVKTISLNDLLEKYNAPKIIDYLSIDTEGSEFEILSHFNFSKYSFKVITCEHNFTPMREEIHQLLSNQGFTRVYEDVSHFDDWYINTSLLSIDNFS